MLKCETAPDKEENERTSGNFSSFRSLSAPRTSPREFSLDSMPMMSIVVAAACFWCVRYTKDGKEEAKKFVHGLEYILFPPSIPAKNQPSTVAVPSSMWQRRWRRRKKVKKNDERGDVIRCDKVSYSTALHAPHSTDGMYFRTRLTIVVKGISLVCMRNIVPSNPR